MQKKDPFCCEGISSEAILIFAASAWIHLISQKPVSYFYGLPFVLSIAYGPERRESGGPVLWPVRRSGL